MEGKHYRDEYYRKNWDSRRMIRSDPSAHIRKRLLGSSASNQSLLAQEELLKKLIKQRSKSTLLNRLIRFVKR